MVAARLSEIDSATVLLLEAGKSAPPETAVPLLVMFAPGGDLNWGIKAIPQVKTHSGYKNNVIATILPIPLKLISNEIPNNLGIS